MSRIGTSAGNLARLTGGIADENGNPLLSTNITGGDAQPIGPAISRVITAGGVANGDFSLAPTEPELPIGTNNALPLWDTYTSDPSLTLRLVEDPASASGYLFAITIAAGAPDGATARISRLVPVGSSRARSYVHQARAHIIGSTGASSGSINAYISARYYRRDGTATGTIATSTTPLTAINAEISAQPNSHGIAADAGYLYLETGITVTTGGAATTTTETAQIAEVRVDSGSIQTMITDQIAGNASGGTYIVGGVMYTSIADATGTTRYQLDRGNKSSPNSKGVFDLSSAAIVGGRYSGAQTSVNATTVTALTINATTGRGVLPAPSSNTIAINAGTYLIIARAAYSSDSTGTYRRLFLTAAGSTIATADTPVFGTAIHHATVTTVYRTTSSTTIGLSADHNATSAVGITADELSIIRLGEAW